ncbi:MAG: hypothetical protein IJF56_08030 [Clostridia bacterium]|nr:hypothetical protein [Clostridia bacterium]
MMYMVYFLVALISVCGLLGAVDLIVRAWEKADRRRVVRPVVYAPAAPKARITPLYTVGRLPDREEVRNVYCLADQFADRFREVVNS